MCQQPARKDNFLLISAGERFDRCVCRSCLNVKEFDILLRDLVRLRLGIRTEESAQNLLGKDNIVTHRKISDDAIHFTVFRQICDSMLHCIYRF